MIQYSEKVDAHIYVKGGAVTKPDWRKVIDAAWDQWASAPGEEDNKREEAK